jgi:translocation and assembly module TamA
MSMTGRNFIRYGVCASLLALAAAGHAARAQDVQGSEEPQEEGEGDQTRFTLPSPPDDVELPEIEPIITDEEFEERVPSIDPADDPELEGPLETIEEFERRLAGEEQPAATDAGEEPPLGDPALADGDPVEPIGDAPIRDAELAAPLPPLETFDVEPVEFAEAEEEGDAVEIGYAIRLTGLEEADEETPDDLRDLFNDLSSLREGDGKAANIAQVRARLSEDSELLKRILASQGYYGASVETRIERVSQEGEQALTAVLDAVPGARYVFADIVIDAPPTEPPGLIRDAMALQVGEPIVAARVQGAEAQVALTLPTNGYPFAQLGERDILLDRATGDGVYTLPVDTGPRARFGGIRTTGDLAFDAEHVEELARFERGELYDSRMVDDLRKALVATGLFETVAVSPERSDETAEDGTEFATLLVKQQAGPPRTLSGSAGFGTGQGFRLEGSWAHRNLFPPEGALIANLVAGTQEQGAGVTFRRSNAGRRDRRFQASAEVLRSDFEAFEAFTGRLSALVSYDSTQLWQKPLTYAYGAQLIATNEQDFNFTKNALDRRTFFIAGLIGQVGIDRTDSLLNAREGFRLTALVEPEGSVQGGFDPYVRVRIDGSAYYSPTDAITLAGRVRVGTIQGIDRFDLAPSRRFYGGGGGSVRGFGFQELGPRVAVPNPNFDPDDPDETADPQIFRPLGGLSQNEVAAEVRYRFGNFGVVAFVDAGQVYEDSVPDFSDIRFGVGLGARYYTNFGPVRFDVGIPLNRQPGENSVAVYVSIGQAF